MAAEEGGAVAVASFSSVCAVVGSLDERMIDSFLCGRDWDAVAVVFVCVAGGNVSVCHHEHLNYKR